MIAVVLASASPARLSTLRSAGVHPRVLVSDVDEAATLRAIESVDGPLAPHEIPLRLARAKCADVTASLDEQQDREGDVVLGADSVLELDGLVHGKPHTAHEARRRWQVMRGHTGVLHSGHWLIDRRDPASPRAVGETASSTVHFADLDDAEIEDYVATGEPLHVAGAFTIDALGGPYVSRIEGDHHAVVGLSLPLLRVLLRRLGISWHDLRTAE